MKRFRLLLLANLLLLGFWGCKDKGIPTPEQSDVIDDFLVTVNPIGVAPLTARIELETTESVSVQIRVKGMRGEESDLVHRFEEVSDNHSIPVLGLYPAVENTVILTFFDAAGDELESAEFLIETEGLIPEMPEVNIDTRIAGATTEGYILANYFGHTGDFLPLRPLMFDEFGDVRWFLDYSKGAIPRLFYDNGMNRFANGNLFFGEANGDNIYEIDMLGSIKEIWDLKGYGFHHHLIEKSNGNFLATVNDPTKSTVEDVIIEMDRNNGEIVNKWDLTLALDKNRRAWPTNRADLNVDWFHANGLAYNEDDNSLIISGRTQGTVKLTHDNELVWILAPHKEWGTSGSGQDLTEFLLQPLDAQGQPITDSLVLVGDSNHPDFEWSWYQHSPMILPNGNLLLFDNGDNRNYGNSTEYSRAVEYKIDEVNRTIQQVWDYGSGRGGATYAPIVSRVNYYPASDNVVFTPGSVFFGGTAYGKVVEIDYSTGNVVFEATVIPPIAPFNITYHNAQRLTLYP
ncbi:MAG: aryl-sulfate sulfotransferase [Bacteroidota bacterium]